MTGLFEITKPLNDRLPKSSHDPSDNANDSSSNDASSSQKGSSGHGRDVWLCATLSHSPNSLNDEFCSTHFMQDLDKAFYKACEDMIAYKRWPP